MGWSFIKKNLTAESSSDYMYPEKESSYGTTTGRNSQKGKQAQPHAF